MHSFAKCLDIYFTRRISNLISPYPGFCYSDCTYKNNTTPQQLNIYNNNILQVTRKVSEDSTHVIMHIPPSTRKYDSRSCKVKILAYTDFNADI